MQLDRLCRQEILDQGFQRLLLNLLVATHFLQGRRLNLQDHLVQCLAHLYHHRLHDRRLW
jgi:hypothetical protein